MAVWPAMTVRLAGCTTIAGAMVAALIVSVSVPVAEPTGFAAVIATENEPLSIGVPETTPVVD